MENEGSCTNESVIAQSTSKKNLIAVYRRMWLDKINESYVAAVQKIKESFGRSTSRKGFQKNNCTEKSDWEEKKCEGCGKNVF